MSHTLVENVQEARRKQREARKKRVANAYSSVQNYLYDGSWELEGTRSSGEKVNEDELLDARRPVLLYTRKVEDLPSSPLASLPRLSHKSWLTVSERIHDMKPESYTQDILAIEDKRRSPSSDNVYENDDRIPLSKFVIDVCKHPPAFPKQPFTDLLKLKNEESRNLPVDVEPSSSESVSKMWGVSSDSAEAYLHDQGFSEVGSSHQLCPFSVSVDRFPLQAPIIRSTSGSTIYGEKKISGGFPLPSTASLTAKDSSVVKEIDTDSFSSGAINLSTRSDPMSTVDMSPVKELSSVEKKNMASFALNTKNFPSQSGSLSITGVSLPVKDSHAVEKRDLGYFSLNTKSFPTQSDPSSIIGISHAVRDSSSSEERDLEAFSLNTNTFPIRDKPFSSANISDTVKGLSTVGVGKRSLGYFSLKTYSFPSRSKCDRPLKGDLCLEPQIANQGNGFPAAGLGKFSQCPSVFPAGKKLTCFKINPCRFPSRFRI